jgi:hypothetical protein
VIELDHVLIAGRDERGVEGGRHPAWGTANRILPLDGCYLEFIEVVDEERAAKSRVGQWVAAAPKGRPFGWAVRTDSIETVAERLGIEVADGARGALRWRMGGVAEAAAEPYLPFYIQWGEGSAHPGSGSGGVEMLELSGDPERLAEWLGPHQLPISVRPGTPAVKQVVLSTGVSVP